MFTHNYSILSFVFSFPYILGEGGDVSLASTDSLVEENKFHLDLPLHIDPESSIQLCHKKIFPSHLFTLIVMIGLSVDKGALEFSKKYKPGSELPEEFIPTRKPTKVQISFESPIVFRSDQYHRSVRPSHGCSCLRLSIGIGYDPNTAYV